MCLGDAVDCFSATSLPEFYRDACKTSAQFIRGVSEPTVPDVNLTRSKDGSSGTATFVFAEPSVFEASEDLGDITGLYMRDAEGELSTVDVQVDHSLWQSSS